MTAGAGPGAALSGLLRGRLREVSALIEQRGEAALCGTSLPAAIAAGVVQQDHRGT